VSRNNKVAGAATTEVDVSRELDAAVTAAVLFVGSVESFRLMNGRRAAGLDSWIK
jgi:hypothetical protein